MAYKTYNESELNRSVKLCLENGELNPDSIGWSRHTTIESNLSGRRFRKKRWNYWAIANDDCLFSVTVSNLDYAGMVFLYFYDFNSHDFVEKTYLTPLGRGCNMPSSVDGAIIFSHPKIQIEMTPTNGNTHISVNCTDFNGVPLSAAFSIQYPDDYETLNVIIPWDKRTFQFTSKHQGMSVSGTIKLDNKSYKLDPRYTFGCLDYGRGIWPSRISWNWAYVSGIADSRRIGINLGAKWTDNTGMTENAYVIDGKLTKLSEDVIFEFDNTNYMKPWTIKTALSDQLNLIFHPSYERVANSNFVIIKSELHQMIGHVTGHIKTKDGTIIKLQRLTGCAEDHYTRW